MHPFFLSNFSHLYWFETQQQHQQIKHGEKNNNKLAQHNVDISNWNWYSASCSIKNKITSEMQFKLNRSHSCCFPFSFWYISLSLSLLLLLIQFIYFFSLCVFILVALFHPPLLSYYGKRISSYVEAKTKTTKLNYWNSVVTLCVERRQKLQLTKMQFNKVVLWYNSNDDGGIIIIEGEICQKR